jgi:hypothetical protein
MRSALILPSMEEFSAMITMPVETMSPLIAPAWTDRERAATFPSILPLTTTSPSLLTSPWTVPAIEILAEALMVPLMTMSSVMTASAVPTSIRRTAAVTPAAESGWNSAIAPSPKKGP